LRGRSPECADRVFVCNVVIEVWWLFYHATDALAISM